ncbi:MAG: NAD-dependent epimerase/dehydratase family protein [Deltaproteobacteria bacterium]|nr:NAD-dependent epimerase/dehydratase family protein [Deltaproteobacteria bacterium]
MTEDRRQRTDGSGESWLITGGCGFIGRAIVRRILQEPSGDTIRVLDNLSVGSIEDLEKIADGSLQLTDGQKEEGSIKQGAERKKIRRSEGEEERGNFDIRGSNSNVQVIVGDITDPDVCLTCSKGMDVIVHLAANTGVGPSVDDPVSDMKNNVAGTLNMLEAARKSGVKRFVFASSGAPVGEVEPPIHENLAPRPVSPYGASKLAGEGYCSAYFGSFGIETVVLRFGNVYGPGSSHKNSVVAKFIKHILAEERLPIYGDGSQTRDFIYIADIVQAILLCSEVQNIGGEVFQIATHREHTVEEVAEALNRLAEKHLGRRSEVVYEQARTGDVKRNYSDISKARRMLGFEPKWQLEKGLEETFLWYLGRMVHSAKSMA